MLRARVLRALVFLFLTVTALPASAQQLGSIIGKITDSSGAVLPGVTVEATSNVLPSPRTTVSGADGVYQLPALPPGTYKLTFSLQGLLQRCFLGAERRAFGLWQGCL